MRKGMLTGGRRGVKAFSGDGSASVGISAMRREWTEAAADGWPWNEVWRAAFLFQPLTLCAGDKDLRRSQKT